jgi:nucleoside-diphosphate-sugar epimerase
LPLGAITQNLRSLAAVENLINLMVMCLSHPDAANQTFLVGDVENLSTAELLTGMGMALNNPPRLIKVPKELLKLGAALAPKQTNFERLCHSLQVKMAYTRAILHWKPPVSVDHSTRLAVRQFQL